MASRPTFSTLVQSVAEAEARHTIEKPLFSVPNGQMKTKEPFRKRYLKPLLKVIDESDIIMLVLDARDPEGCRSRLVEEEVRKRVIEGKRLVFVMNKIGEHSILYLSFRLNHCKILYPKPMRKHG